jgi:hypothetical protein
LICNIVQFASLFGSYFNTPVLQYSNRPKPLRSSVSLLNLSIGTKHGKNERPDVS